MATKTASTARAAAPARKKKAQVRVFTPKQPDAKGAGPQRAAVQLGRSLGLRVSSRDRLIAEIRKGFRVATFEHLARQLDLPERELAGFVAISERTLIRRRKAGRLNADESDRIARIAMLFDEAVELFEGDRARASHWFRSPRKALGGAAPIEYADTEPGAREVRDLIGRIEHGVFA
jgi:putative toxin-antitoxin system antitoxin component (TIGR02293 family)